MAQKSGVQETLYSVTWSGKAFFASGGSGTIISSPDSVSWTARDSGTANGFISIASSGRRLVVVGDHGAIYSSPDGASWMDVRDKHGNGSLKYRDNYSSVIWTGTKFAAVGGQGVLAVSSDGVTWSLSFPAYLRSIVFVKRRSVDGDDSKIEQSPDGVTWERRDGFPASTVSRIIPAGSGYLGLAGYAVLSSNDGITWSYQLMENGVYAQRHSYDGLDMDSAGIAGSGNGYIAVGAEGKMITSRGRDEMECREIRNGFGSFRRDLDGRAVRRRGGEWVRSDIERRGFVEARHR